MDIEKAWHGLHFLLTGTASEGTAPLDFILRSGRAIGDVDVGYGPARAFSSDELRDIVRALGPITPDELRKKFDPKQLIAAEVYPEI